MLTDELFMLSEQRDMTKASDLCTEAQNAAQKLLNQYVRVQGLQISQVILVNISKHVKTTTIRFNYVEMWETESI